MKGLLACNDVNWARDACDGNTRSGLLHKCKESPTYWISKLQTVTMMPTTEARFTALPIFVRKLLCARRRLMDFGYKEMYNTAIKQDNLRSSSWEETMQELWLVGHFCLSYHYVCENIEKRFVKVEYTSPSLQTHSRKFLAQKCIHITLPTSLQKGVEIRQEGQLEGLGKGGFRQCVKCLRNSETAYA